MYTIIYMNTGKMLQEMAKSFQKKIDEKFALIVDFEIEDTKEMWHVVVEKGEVRVTKGRHNKSGFRFITSTETLRKIYEGKMTALTAAGKSKVSDSAPLDWKLAEGIEFSSINMEKALFFIQHFFNRDIPEKILLGEEYSRVVHGGHAIPLYYHPGLRSAWYLVKKGELLNEPGETNPFPQAFVFIEGEGFAKIGDKKIPVKANESYYIPPNIEHNVWTESDTPLVFIWFAWGEGA